MDKSQDTGGRENHGCDGLTVSRRPLDALKKAVQDRKKWRMLVEEKTRNWERTNVKLTEENDNGIPLLDNIL